MVWDLLEVGVEVEFIEDVESPDPPFVCGHFL